MRNPRFSTSLSVPGADLAAGMGYAFRRRVAFLRRLVYIIQIMVFSKTFFSTFVVPP